MEGDYDGFDQSTSRYNRYDNNRHDGHVFLQGHPREKNRCRPYRASPGGHGIELKRKNMTCQGVFNLSNKELNNKENIYVDKGLKFAPPKKIDTTVHSRLSNPSLFNPQYT